MPLCSDEICWGKIVSGNLPPRLSTTICNIMIYYAYDIYIYIYIIHNSSDVLGCIFPYTCTSIKDLATLVLPTKVVLGVEKPCGFT